MAYATGATALAGILLGFLAGLFSFQSQEPLVSAVRRDDPAKPADRPKAVMSTTYLAAAALEQLDAAQAQIDAHVHTRLGFCTTCRALAPCAARLAASAVFAKYCQLPHRRPGLALRGATW
jgi:hypothetical protein